MPRRTAPRPLADPARARWLAHRILAADLLPATVTEGVAHLRLPATCCSKWWKGWRSNRRNAGRRYRTDRWRTNRRKLNRAVAERLHVAVHALAGTSRPS